MRTIPIAVFVSGGGSNLQTLLDVEKAVGLRGGRIDLVFSNNPEAKALERAKAAGKETLCIPSKGYPGTREDYDRAVLAELRKRGIVLVCLAGYMRVLTPVLVEAFRGCLMNIHPALLPKFGGPGFYGHHVHEAVLRAGEKESGATVHFVTEGVDAGPIIVQGKVPVAPDDTPETLAARVLEVEHLLYPAAVQLFCMAWPRVLEQTKVSSQSEGSMEPGWGKVRRALLSVSDKTGLVDFAKALSSHGVELISTGGTCKALKDAGLAVKDISEVTGFPEMLDGRVKTLHPVVHGGLLALRDNPEHVATIEKHGIRPIDLVCINLYPFEATVSKPGVQLHDAIENIDIGGPSMIRSASKNYRSVTVVTSPKRYAQVLEDMGGHDGATSLELRQELAVEAFGNTARYDSMISNWLHPRLSKMDWPEAITFSGTKVQEMRYGENPHQKAAFYRERASKQVCLADAQQHQGKELSYNNIMDADAAVVLVKEFDEPAAIIVKHTNPCGAALGKDACDAFVKAFEADPLSAFGGIVALNRPVDAATAQVVLDRLKFFEILIAPSFEEGALRLLEARKNLRVLTLPGLGGERAPIQGYSVRRVEGGFLVQDFDQAVDDKGQWKVVSEKQPDPRLARDMDFGWRLVKHVKSNAIVLVKDGVSLGVGAGQMNRVGSLGIAIAQAGEKARGAVMASDALLPFRDSVDACAKAGVAAIIQTGGSVKDAETIAAANEHGLPMIFTGVRHFKH